MTIEPQRITDAHDTIYDQCIQPLDAACLSKTYQRLCWCSSSRYQAASVEASGAHSNHLLLLGSERLASLV